MIASQVSVPAATVRQFEETAMSGGDLNRNAVFQALMQVGATPLMSGTESRQVGDQVQTIGRGAPVPPPIDGAKLFAYPSLYYPAASSASSAAIVTVASGQERTGIDLQVRPVPMVKVSGTVVGRNCAGGDASRATRSPGIRRRWTNGGRRRDGHGRQRRIRFSCRAVRRLRHQDRSGAKTRDAFRHANDVCRRYEHDDHGIVYTEP